MGKLISHSKQKAEVSNIRKLVIDRLIKADCSIVLLIQLDAILIKDEEDDMSKIKRAIDFYKYLYNFKKKETISIAFASTLTLLSIPIFINELASFSEQFNESSINLLLLGIVFLSVINLIWNIVTVIGDLNKYTKEGADISISPKRSILKDDSYVDMRKLVPVDEKGWENPFKVIIGEKSDKIDHHPVNPRVKIALFSRTVNGYLWDNDIRLKTKPAKSEQLNKFIKKNKETLLPFLQYKYFEAKKDDKLLFNEKKLSLGSDINFGTETASVYQSNYFNSLLTNEIASCVMERKDGTIIYNATNYYPCNTVSHTLATLQPLKVSRMSNHIGVSTLAITRDNYLVIRKQSSRNQQNNNLLVPTGSGSCDWTDRKETLIETLVEAMNRELTEENKLGVDGRSSISQTKVTGFYRWVERGGKPEFTGITKLNMDIEDLEVDTEELVDLSNKSLHTDILVKSIDTLKEVLEEVSSRKEHISLPLYMCITNLLHYIDTREEEVKDLLNIN